MWIFFLNKYVTGSICPKKSDYYLVKATGYMNLYAAFERSYTGKTKSHEWPAKYLYANRCYPLEISADASSDLDLKAYLNGTLIDSNLVTLVDCLTDDCLPNYYTDKCEKYADVDCNGNGDPDWGRNSENSLTTFSAKTHRSQSSKNQSVALIFHLTTILTESHLYRNSMVFQTTSSENHTQRFVSKAIYMFHKTQICNFN